MRRAPILLTLTAALVHSVARADDWPQWLGPKRDSVWRETGIVQKFPTNGPPVLWRVALGAGYSGPVVAKGRVYVTDRQLAQGTDDSSNIVLGSGPPQ